MKLSPQEINTLITKIHSKYSEYSLKYNEKWFDVNAFKERLNLARRNKMNMEAFALAEITNFEEVKSRYEKKKKDKNRFNEKMNAMMEENFRRIKKYPEINFYQQANIEIKYLYGALDEYSKFTFPILWSALKNTPFRDKLLEFENQLYQVALKRGAKHPALIEDHIILLKRKNITELDKERHQSSYMKESAFILYDIIDYCDYLLLQNPKELQYPLTFDSYSQNTKDKKKLNKKFTGYTCIGCVNRVKEESKEILEDFRLTAFKRGN